MFSQYRDENKLEQEVSFIGGSTQYISFEILDRNDSPIDLTGAEIRWALSYIGQNANPILIKDNKSRGGITTTQKGVFTVELTPNDTKMLGSNKYEQEPTIIQANGKVLKPAYGILNIKKGAM